MFPATYRPSSQRKVCLALGKRFNEVVGKVHAPDEIKPRPLSIGVYFQEEPSSHCVNYHINSREAKAVMLCQPSEFALNILWQR